MAIKETLPFNFNEIYSYIGQKFTDAGYDYQEGSNTMQLVTAMSYLTSMLNANTAVNINETLLPLARKRDMVLQDARVLGYEIEHKRSYKYDFILNYKNPGYYTIDRYTDFFDGYLRYYYMGENIPEFEVTAEEADTTNSYSLGISELQCNNLGGTWNSEFGWAEGLSQEVTEENGGTYKTYKGVIKKIRVTEGKLYKYQDNQQTLTHVIETVNVIDADGTEVQKPEYYMDVPFTEIEEEGLHVFLSYVDENGQRHDKEFWNRAETFVIDKDTVLNKEYIRLDNIEFKTPRIYFKLGEVGKELRVGTIVNVNALESSGKDGALVETPFARNTTDIEIIEHTLVQQGSDEESIESIKQNAPIYHNTANRMITKPDYIAFCNRQSAIKTTDVWDGHDEFPNKPGHIWFSFIPSSTQRSFSVIDTVSNNNYILDNDDDPVNWYMEESEVLSIWDYLENFRVPTLIYHHRNPIYFNFNYEIEIVRYNTSTTPKVHHENVFNVINNFFLGEGEEKPAETYLYEYFNSSLVKRIDTELTDITGINMSLTTDICFCSENIIEERFIEDSDNKYFKEVRFHLGLPFEEIYDSEYEYGINTNNLPSINSNEFLGDKTIFVDFTVEPTITNIGRTDKMYEYPIKMENLLVDTITVGTYRLFKRTNPGIEVVLFIKDADYDVQGYVEGIHELDLNESVTLPVKYPSPNIRFIRNTIPRLKSVTFI